MSSDEPTDVGGDRPRRRLDVASCALLLIGLVTAGLTCWLVADHQVNALAILPSINRRRLRRDPHHQDAGAARRPLSRTPAETVS